LLGEALVDHGPVGEEYIYAIHDSIQRLVALDIEFGGDAVSIYAMRTFRAVWCRLRQGAYRAGNKRDLYVAAAELAELIGWLLTISPMCSVFQATTALCKTDKQLNVWI
jgi:hypothetical protein